MVTEVFACTPLEALCQPRPLTDEIMEARAFMRAYADVMTAGETPGVPEPTGAMVDEVAELMRERIAAEREGHGL